jgi:cysteine-rich repeat protein
MLQARSRLPVLVLIALAMLGASTASAQILCGQTLQRTIIDTDRPDALVFLAAPGEVVSITVVAAPGTHHLFTPRWEVFDPLGARVLTSTGERRCTGRCQTAPLPTRGLFVLQIFDPGRIGAGDYTVSLEAVSGSAIGFSNGPPVPICARFPGGFSDGTQPITHGVPFDGRISPIGETDTFTFVGTVGEHITIGVTTDGTTADAAFAPHWVLFDPQGRVVTADGTVPPLPDVGVYTVLVFDADDDATGAYTVRVDIDHEYPSTTSTSVTSTTTEPTVSTTTSSSTTTLVTVTTTTTSVTIAPPTFPPQPPALVLESTLRPVGPREAIGAAVAATDTRVVLGAPGIESVYVLDVEGTPDAPQFGTLVSTLVPPQASAGFGSALAIAGTVVAVGAPGAGSAYLFGVTGSTAPVLLQPPIATGGDGFGTAVAVAGTDVVIGAPAAARDGVAAAGRAYRFGPTGEPLAVLEAPGEPQSGTLFGAAVASLDDTVFVGAPGGDAGGRVYAFSGEENVVVYGGDDGLGSGAAFGAAIAASDRRVYVGAPGARGGSGVVLVLEARQGGLVREIGLPEGSTARGFGATLLLTDEALLVGAPASDDGPGTVFVFDPEGAKLLETIGGGDEAGDRFGAALAVSVGRLLVGAPRADAGTIDGGAAYLYPTLTGGDGPEAVFRQRLSSAAFGAAVVASGGDAIVGDPLVDGARGAVERFTIADGAMQERVGGPAADAARFGAALAAAPDEVLVGAPFEDGGAGADVGAVYALAGGALRRRIDDPFPVAGDQFGFAVAVSGIEAVVGAPLAGDLDTGAVHIFDRPSGERLLTLRKPVPLTGDFFGAAVAAEGDQVLVGAPLDSGAVENGGAVYLFRRSTAMLDRAIVAPDAAAGDLFGSAVALTPTQVIVGAPLADVAGVETGRVYVFDRSDGSLRFTLDNPTPDAGDQFGAAVAVVGGGILVGAPRDDEGAADTGAAHLFDADTGALRQTLRNPTQGGFDRFGAAVAARDAGALVGAPGVSRVYAFTPTSTPLAEVRRVRTLATAAYDVVCGNGLVEGLEACDDGNTVDADDCRNDCTLPACCTIRPIPAAQCNDGNSCTTDTLDPLTGCTSTDNGSCCDEDNDCASGKCRLCLGCSLYPWDCCEKGSQCLAVAPECGTTDCFEFAYCACAGGLACDDGTVPAAIDQPFLDGCNQLRLEESFASDVSLQGNERLKLSRSRAKAARRMVRKAARMTRKLANQNVVTKQCRQAILGRTRTVKQAIPKGRRLKRCVLNPETP